MKIQVLSDLHLNTFRTEQNIPVARDRDVLVLAGDIGTYKSAWPFIEKQLEYSPVIYVPGNHEYYHHDINKVDAYWEKMDEHFHDFYYLNGEFVYLDGIMFLGATLWTDFNKGDEILLNLAKTYMNDFTVIKNFTANNCYRHHMVDKEILNTVLTEYPWDKAVVITHHAPSEKSIDLRFVHEGIYNYLFVSDLEYEIERWKPNLWIHGHTHSHFDYMVGDTRVVSNPRGYPYEVYKDISRHVEAMIVEV